MAFKKESFKKLIQMVTIIVLLFLVFTLLNCTRHTVATSKEHTVENVSDVQNNKAPAEEIPYFNDEEEPMGKENDYSESFTDTEQEQNNSLSEKELLKYRPNELGEVMILMYHQIGDTESEWVRTPQNLRKDLLNLYQNGYQLVSLLDYVRGNIGIEAGKSPVVITFDDATRDHLNFIDTDGSLKIDPDCAVSILEDFCGDHPDFGKGATFYIYYPNPFGQEQYIKEKLEFLLERGYEIGNHTYSHADLSLLDNEDVKREIALNIREVNKSIKGYEVKSLALPYGNYPQNKDILAEGKYMGYSYTNEAVLLVGSNPSLSPFNTDFDPLAVPRIRASEIMVENSGLYDWLNFFNNYPEKRYVSDGNNSTIIAPCDFMDKLDKNSAYGKKVDFY